jgi:hypothetical protein
MKKESILSLFSSISLFAALVTGYRLITITADPKNAIFMGFSSARLILIASDITISLLLLGIIIILYLFQTTRSKIILSIDRALAQPIPSKIFLLLCGLGLAAGIVVRLTPLKSMGDSKDQILRLLPLIDLIMVFASLAVLAWFLWSGRKIETRIITADREMIRYTTVSGSIVFFIFIFIMITQIGITPDRSGWYPPGTPILFSQFVLAFLILGIGIVIATQVTKKPVSSKIIQYGRRNIDILICGGLWVAAFILWWSEPLRKPSYFSPTPVAPNYEYYPYSDGAEYDGYAQELLIGNGNQLGLIRRPLYAYFLAGLHLIVGQDYDQLITLQIAVLAIIPSLMYTLVRQLGNRAAGFVTAVLVLLREHNSIALTNIIEVSHSKLLLSEVPAMGLMLLLCILVIRWLTHPDEKLNLAVLAGAILGLLAMIRSQSIILAPVILLAAFWVLRPNRRRIVVGLSLFVVGLCVTIGPWMIRSQQIAGRFVIEDTDKYIDLFASGYTFTPYESIATIPGETRSEHYDRMVNQIMDFIKSHPREVFDFYSAHFFHNEIGKVVYLPLVLSFQDLRSYVNAMGFWKEPLRGLSLGSMLLLILNLGLISLGIAASYKKIKRLVLIPILICTAYSLSVIPARLSSGRFILPADWITEVFLAIGILEFGAILLALFNSKSNKLTFIQSDEMQPATNSKPAYRSWLFPTVLLLVFGTGFALTPELIPQKYPSKSKQEIIREYFSTGLKLDNGTSYSREELDEFTARYPNAILIIGSDLYPRFYKTGEYWGDDNPFNLEARKFDRLQFDLIGSQPATVLLPLKAAPQSFPMGVDILVIGCGYDFGVKALAVKNVDGEAALTADPWQGLSCQDQGTPP